jgi:hypothetical protein
VFVEEVADDASQWSRKYSVSKGVRHGLVKVQIIPGDYIEQSEHTRPLSGTSLAEVGEVLEVVRANVAVDGELTGVCQSRPLNTSQRGKLTLRKNKYMCSSEMPSVARR